MNRRLLSLVGFLLGVAGLVYLIMTRSLFNDNPVTILVQAGAAALMLWARVTFGLRSFHADAGPSSGPLITSGPYRWWRHPIYASIIYFTWAGVVPQIAVDSAAAALVVTGGLFARMILEEKFLGQAYPEYAAYCRTAKRIVPYVI